LKRGCHSGPGEKTRTVYQYALVAGVERERALRKRQGFVQPLQIGVAVGGQRQRPRISWNKFKVTFGAPEALARHLIGLIRPPKHAQVLGADQQTLEVLRTNLSCPLEQVRRLRHVAPRKTHPRLQVMCVEGVGDERLRAFERRVRFFVPACERKQEAVGRMRLGQIRGQCQSPPAGAFRRFEIRCFATKPLITPTVRVGQPRVRQGVRLVHADGALEHLTRVVHRHALELLQQLAAA